MFGDIGWAELLVIGIVALIVIGPQDLPDMFRQLGRFTAKLRQMSREFSRAMDQAAKDSGVKDVAKDMKAMTSPASMGINKVKEAADRFEKWDPMKSAVKPGSAVKPLVPPPLPATPVAHPTIAEPSGDLITPDKPLAVGPATQALASKQAAKSAILKEAAAQVKAVDAATATSAAAAESKPSARPRAKVAKPNALAGTVAAKPRAQVKAKKADQL